MTYILNSIYNQKHLGSTVPEIMKRLKNHWQDMLAHPEEYEEKYIMSINHMLGRNYETVEEIQDDYSVLIDEEYIFEEV